MQAGGGDWWTTRWFLAAAMIGAAVPLLWPAIPPLTDLPGHLGRFRVMLDGGQGPLAAWFTFHWRIVGNMGVDLPVAVLGPLIGLEPAVKAVTIAIPALTVAGCLALSRAAHGQVSPYALVALPLAYSQPFHMGFVNFALSMALALLALAGWMRMAPGWRRAALFAPAAILIWTAHVFGWAVLALTALAVEVARGRRPLHAGVALLPLAAPLPIMLAASGGAASASIGFFDVPGKLLAMLMTFRDRWFAWDVLSLAIVLTVIAYGTRKGAQDRRLVYAAVALLAAFVLLPARLMGSAFADMRAAPYVLLLALVALRPVGRRQARAVALIGLAFCAARLVSTTASVAIHAARQDRLFAALDHVPVGGRVALLTMPACDDPWAMARLDHVGGVATARRRAFANDGFQHYAGELLAIDYPAARPFERDPSQFLPCDGGAGLRARIAAIPRGAFDRLWLVNLPARPPRHLPGMTRLWSGDRDALYAID